MNKIITLAFIAILTQSCGNNKSIDKKGFQVNEIEENEQGEKVVGLPIDSLKLETQPKNVLTTKNPEHRLVPIYKVNYDKKTHQPFIGSNSFHNSYDEVERDGNNWNSNYLPGFSALSGYNLVNVSHYNYTTKIQNEFFSKPVLIKTLYYPAFSKDTLNNTPVTRGYYMISVYDEHTNKDGFLNLKDLRRLYLFDINGISRTELIPKTHSVMSSEYDSDNDIMFVSTKLDNNQNGQIEIGEPTHIFWVDLKNPMNSGVQYKN